MRKEIKLKIKYSPAELREFIISVSKKELKDVTQTDSEILFTLENIQCEKVLSDIKEKQIGLQLYQPNKFLNFYISPNKLPHDILFGCQSCLNNKITHIRHSSKCNVSCSFCYYIGINIPNIPKYGYKLGNFIDRHLTKEELFLSLEKQILGKVDAIGWLGKEPLLEIEKIKEVAPFLKENGIHQYLYTNGVLVNKENIKILSDSGIDEIRFNLQATDFNEDVLNNMKNCVGIFKSVAIETPVYSKSFTNYLKYKEIIVDSGIDQINMPELQVSTATIVNFEKTEGAMYRHRKGYVSPISSRQYVYKLIELASQEKWPFIINDCSNETKFYRDTPYVPKDILYAQINYKTQFNFLPSQNYLYIIDNYIKDEIEIF